MSAHTHRGHCQVCLRIQAIDMHTGLIAKHGYNVKYGYFAGQCPGTRQPTMHVQRSLTDKVIETAKADASKMAQITWALRNGEMFPEMAYSGKDARKTNERGRVEIKQIYVPFADAPAHYQQAELQKEIYKAERSSKQHSDYAKFMGEWADRIFCKVDAYRVEELEPNEWKVGDEIRIGGKTGFTTKIEAIEQRLYTTRGFRKGSETIMTPHALITRRARPETRSRTGIIKHEARIARTYWEPLRHIKRPKSPLIESLRKAGLL